MQINIDRYQMEAERFKKTFSALKKKRIVLYGIGRLSATLIPRVKDYFNIVGVMDRDIGNIGKIVFGLPVLSLEVAEKNADCIIINTTSIYWQTIYKRIERSKIPVYFLNGQFASLVTDNDKTNNNPYWNVNFNDYRKLAEAADIISFDLFDTLIQRTCYLLTDVYLLATKLLRSKFGIDIDYYDIRQQVCSELPINYKWRDLENALKKKYPFDMVDAMLEAELSAEYRLCVPRKTICEYCRNLIAEGKDVYIISDMYLPRSFIKKLLDKIGLKVIDKNIWISSEINKSKRDGDLWIEFVNRVANGKKAVHFGDDIVSDVKMAEKVGVVPCYIMNSRTMLANSNISSLETHIKTLYESLVIGLLLSRLFDSPFALSKYKGRIRFNTCSEIGYIVYAPLIVTFLLWLHDMTKDAGLKKLFFFARDGFFLEKDYRRLCSVFKEDIKMPEIHYLYISRQAAWIASISSEDDFNNILLQPYVGTFKNYMKSRWDIIVDERTKEINDRRMDTFKGLNELKSVMNPYLAEIKDEIRRDRDNYILYLDRLGVDRDCGFVDLGVHGTIQLYLSKILGYPIKSWNLVAQEDIFSDGNEQKSCYRGPDKSGYVSPLAENVIFIETLLTAPYGMIRRVDSQGNKISDELPMGQKHFSDKELMNNEIEQFMIDIAHIFDEKPIFSSVEREFISDLMMIFYKKAMFNRDAVRSLKYENTTMHIDETKIFD